MPNKEQAEQFALMLVAGMPGQEAIVYFFDSVEEALPHLDPWQRSALVRKELEKLQGGNFQTMDLDTRIQKSLDKNYSEMAYFLYSRNYIDLSGAEKTKADTCRQALEVKLAGLAGKTEPIARFWDDVKAGRVKLYAPAGPTSSPAEPKAN